jgi:quinol monooxygenase YgiN
MVCAVTAEFVCIDGLGGKLIELLSQMIPETLRKKGAISIEMCVDQDNPDRVVLIQRWQNRTDHETYVAYRKESGDIDTIAEMLISPPKFIWLDIIVV